MNKPRLIYYNDAHHFHGKRVDPSLNLHKMCWPVDEVVGTGVELLAFGMGYGDVYFHDSKIGRTIGEEKETWESFIDWRIMRMVKDARVLGTDQLREIIKRGRHMNLPVFPSLRLQSANDYRTQRCGWLKWHHGAAVCLGEGEYEPWAYDFNNELVRQDKLAMIREMLEDYEADGMELDFMFQPVYFKGGEEEKGIVVINDFIAAVRALADEIGAAQNRHIPLLARVYSGHEENLAIGLDVETWLHQGYIDYVVGQVSDNLFETAPPDISWLPQAADTTVAAAYLRPPHIVYDERTIFPHIEMFRALRQTLEWQGFAGLYLVYLPWPFSQREYQILREVAYPEITARHDKRYLLQPHEGNADAHTTPSHLLPAPLEEGKTLTVPITIADDLDSARRDGEMRPPHINLGLRQPLHRRRNRNLLQRRTPPHRPGHHHRRTRHSHPGPLPHSSRRPRSLRCPLVPLPPRPNPGPKHPGNKNPKPGENRHLPPHPKRPGTKNPIQRLHKTRRPRNRPSPPNRPVVFPHITTTQRSPSTSNEDSQGPGGGPRADSLPPEPQDTEQGVMNRSRAWTPGEHRRSANPKG